MTRTQIPTTGLVSERRMIPSDTAGIELQLINRHLKGVRQFTAGYTLVMMHGATFPSASLFDVPMDGESFMDVLARAGYDVWAVNLGGQGRLLAVLLSGGDAHDCPVVRKVKPSKHMLGDKAYDSAELREELHERGTKPVIPNRSSTRRDGSSRTPSAG